MKHNFVILFLFLLYCRTFAENTISNNEKQFLETEDISKQETIINEMYLKKDQVPENQKDEFVNFFMNKDLDIAKEKLQELYYDPNFSNQKENIFKYSVKNLNESNFSFVREELKQHEEFYTPDVKEELLKSQSKESAAILLDQIYLGRENLDSEIIFLFKQTQYVESLPVLINSIENHNYVEESFSAISEFRVEEADNFLVNVATDWNYPYRDLGITYLYKIDNKPLAIRIYKDVLKNQIQKPTLVALSLKGLDQIFDYLEEIDKKELKVLLEQVQFLYPDLPLKEFRLSSILYKEPISIKPNHTNKEESKKKFEPIKKDIETKNLKQEVQKKQEKISKPQQTRQNNPRDLQNKFQSLFGEEGKQILIKINNALLTYADSNSEKAKFVQKSYEVCYRVNDQEKIRQFLKQGLLLNNSFRCIVKYVDEQYTRNDLKIFMLQELFVLKRKEAEILVKNKQKFF